MQWHVLFPNKALRKFLAQSEKIALNDLSCQSNNLVEAGLGQLCA